MLCWLLHAAASEGTHERFSGKHGKFHDSDKVWTTNCIKTNKQFVELINFISIIWWETKFDSFIRPYLEHFMQQDIILHNKIHRRVMWSAFIFIVQMFLFPESNLTHRKGRNLLKHKVLICQAVEVFTVQYIYSITTETCTYHYGSGVPITPKGQGRWHF